LAILKCQATGEDLEVATGYVQGEGGALGPTGHQMAGKELYDILNSDDLYANADER
jgi:hypothetical protein